ncbi:MAG TPA: BolA family protein [Geminicoccaceae bacterium]|nr:BolA family protein [Geminicoccaceae bacterium]
MRVANVIRARLARLQPTRLELVDDSARHAGHAGARPEGESHFRLLIVADAFAGRGRLERQRMVYAALGDLLRTDVHALSITALSPAEDAAQEATRRQAERPAGE